MRRLAFLALLVPALSLLSTGCGGGVKEGIPENVDMSKSYAPMAQPLTGSMSPDMAKKGAKSSSQPKTQ
jgi:hypothetical protein